MPPEVMFFCTVMWITIAVVGGALGIAMVLTERDNPGIRMIGYRLLVSSLLAPAALPFWAGWFARYAVLDYLRTRAELRELEQAEPEPDTRPRPTLPDPFRRP